VPTTGYLLSDGVGNGNDSDRAEEDRLIPGRCSGPTPNGSVDLTAERFPEEVSGVPELTDVCATGLAGPPIETSQIADAAVDALLAEARLAPKPGLVDGRASASHPDTTVAMLVAAAEELREPLRQCAEAARTLPLGRALRAHLGEIGRAGEVRMRDVTGGVSTHRGALWTLGLLVAGAAVTESAESAAGFAALVARIPDVGAPTGAVASLGEHVLSRSGMRGAVGEARGGYPHVIRIGLPALRASRRRCEAPDTNALNALIAIMANLADTSVVCRGGQAALRLVHRRAADIVAAGGCGTAEGWARLASFCREADDQRLSMQGSGDLLAATLFLDALS
jgi:triphosphoribosyl-dephospho-CoA synthase